MKVEKPLIQRKWQGVGPPYVDLELGLQLGGRGIDLWPRTTRETSNKL